MIKAKQYGLNFILINMEGTIIPSISCDSNSNGSINYGMASFIRAGGVRTTLFVLDQFDLNETYLNYDIEGAGEEVVWINTQNVPQAVFNEGGTETPIPLQDFIDIMNEWIVFLESIKGVHFLSND